MPLPEVPVARDPIHTRAVRIDAFRRADGAMDLEAELIDTKPFVTPLRSGPREAGAPIHLMRLRLTIDATFTVTDAVAVLDAVPYRGYCDTIAPAYRRLIGLNLRHGFRRALRERLGGVAGCTHLSELAQFLPTAAFQAFAGEAMRRRAALAHDGAAQEGLAQQGTPDAKPFPLDRCHALRSDGPAVAVYYPKWHRPRPALVASQESSLSSKEAS